MKSAVSLLLVFLTTVAVQAQAPNLAPLPPNGFVTLEQIVGDFKSNADAALQKYGGNRLIVYGRVGQVEQAGDGTNLLNVYLQLYKDPTPDVKAQFAPDAFPQNTQMQLSSDQTQAIELYTNQAGQPGQSRPFATVDQRMGVKGSFSGYEDGDIILKNCKKLTAEEIAPLLPQP